MFSSSCYNFVVIEDHPASVSVYDAYVYWTFCRPGIIVKLHRKVKQKSFSLFYHTYFVAKTRNVKWRIIYSGLTHYICFYSSSPYQKVRLGTPINIRLGGTCRRLLLVLWRLKLICIVFKDWHPALQTEQCVPIVKNGRWMLCKNIVAVHRDNHTERHIRSTLWMEYL